MSKRPTSAQRELRESSSSMTANLCLNYLSKRKWVPQLTGPKLGKADIVSGGQLASNVVGPWKQPYQ